jgi:hypothetical protein
MNNPLTSHEKELVQKYFGTTVEKLPTATFKQKLKELRVKYHPDLFQKFEDDTILEMAKERFQEIQTLAEKIEAFHKGGNIGTPVDTKTKMKRDFMSPEALFATKKMKIEIKTSDKDLKYHLFGSSYRWLQYGQNFRIPKTGGRIIMDEDHRGTRIGFEEVVRIYLTFDEGEVVETIVEWLIGKIEGRANSLIIGKELVNNNYEAVVQSIKKQSFLRLAAPPTDS